MDFGVAHLQQSSQTQTGTVLGTADYMSPEQIRSAKVDGRSDIFSAGVILYRLLTNKKPFSGENIQAVFFKVLNQEPPELVLPDGNEMPELQAIVDKALSKTADERYASADDLADDLSDLIQLYHEVLNEDTVFDTMFDPAATPDMDSGTGSDGSGRRRTSSSSTGRVLGATSSGSRTHRPGTSYPTTGAGRTGQMTRAGRTATGRTTVSEPTRMMRGTQVGTVTGTRAGVGIPMQESGGWGKYVAVIALLIAIGGGVFWFTQQSTGNGGTAGASAPPRPTTEVAGQLALAQRSLEVGQLSQALQAVDTVLLAEPKNAAALARQERVNQAIQEIEAAPRCRPPFNKFRRRRRPTSIGAPRARRERQHLRPTRLSRSMPAISLAPRSSSDKGGSSIRQARAGISSTASSSARAINHNTRRSRPYSNNGSMRS